VSSGALLNVQGREARCTLDRPATLEGRTITFKRTTLVGIDFHPAGQERAAAATSDEER